jgi:LysR family cyn operon transcriptional activator
MELRQLRYFLAVVDEGHFTRAAEKLYISQPALSQQIKLLEEEIGAVLLERIGRRIRLTAAGEILATHARRALQELAEA